MVKVPQRGSTARTEGVPVRTNKKLWDRIVKDVKKGNKGGEKNQWSARKAQLAVKKYKSKGGGYKGRKTSNNSLTKWTNQKWRTKSGNNSVMGPQSTGERYLPSKAIKALSGKEYSLTSRRKRKSVKQYSKQPLSISKKVRCRSFGSTKREKLIKIGKSTRKHKKYDAFVKNPDTGKVRKIPFGDNRYEQFRDSTKVKIYKSKNHGDSKRRNNYYKRHSGTSNKSAALKKEWSKSKGKYTPKILSHKYLW